MLTASAIPLDRWHGRMSACPQKRRRPMDITILENGNLKLSLSADEREEAAYSLERAGEDMVLADLTEPYWTNGGYQAFNAGEGNPFVGLTSAPCIAESLSYDEDMKATVEGRLWWFPDYAVRSPVEELIEKSEVVFALAPGYEPEAPTARKPGMR